MVLRSGDRQRNRRLNDHLLSLDLLKTKQEKSLRKEEMEVKRDLQKLRGESKKTHADRKHQKAAEKHLKLYSNAPLSAVISEVPEKRKHPRRKSRTDNHVTVTKLTLSISDTNSSQYPSAGRQSLLPVLPRTGSREWKHSSLSVEGNEEGRPANSKEESRNISKSLTLPKPTQIRKRNHDSSNMNPAGKSLKEFLAHQGIYLDQTHNSVGLTESIIALRNLGKTDDEIWKDIKQCRYLRGYEPEEDRRISRLGANRYVYGMSYEEVHEKLLLKIAKEIDDFMGRRQAEADATTYTLLPTAGLTLNDHMSPQELKVYKMHIKQFL